MEIKFIETLVLLYLYFFENEVCFVVSIFFRE